MRKCILIGLAIFLATSPVVRGQQPKRLSDPETQHELAATNTSSLSRDQTATNAITNAVAVSGSSVLQASGIEHFEGLSDQEIQRKLAGTWVTTWGEGQTTTDIIAANGDFVSETVGLPKGQKIRYEGTFLATNGMVNGQAKLNTQTVTMHLYLVRLDSHELAWSNDINGAQTTFHKVGK